MRATFSAASAPWARREPKSTTARPVAAVTHVLDAARAGSLAITPRRTQKREKLRQAARARAALAALCPRR